MCYENKEISEIDVFDKKGSALTWFWPNQILVLSSYLSKVNALYLTERKVRIHRSIYTTEIGSWWGISLRAFVYWKFWGGFRWSFLAGCKSRQNHAPHNYPALFVISQMIVLRNGGLKVWATWWQGAHWHGKMVSADEAGESKNMNSGHERRKGVLRLVCTWQITYLCQGSAGESQHSIVHKNI